MVDDGIRATRARHPSTAGAAVVIPGPKSGTGDRLRELAGYVAPGPWTFRRSTVDGSLCLYDDAGPDAEPLALIYAGHDLGLYLQQCAPALLLGLLPEGDG